VIIVGAQMYVDDSAPPELRSQAQGMIMTLMTSLGTFMSVTLFDALLETGRRSDGTHDWFTAFLVAAVIAFVLAVVMSILALDGALGKLIQSRRKI
jgi:MFS family permease